MTDRFVPFSDGASVAIGGLTLDSDPDRVALYGNVDLTRDKVGLAAARQLKTIVDAVVVTLSADAGLPDHLEAPLKTVIVKNPFR